MTEAPSPPATITKLIASVVYVVDAPALLSEPTSGRGATRDGYTRQFNNLGAKHALPWTTGPGGHWSRFWSNYLSPKLVEKQGALSPDRAFDYLVPFQIVPTTTLTLPPGSTGNASARVLMYPTSIAVIADVELDDSTPIDKIADQVREVRVSTNWGTGDGSSNRSLDGILADLADHARTELFAAPNAAAGDGATTIHTVVAPALGTLTADSASLPASGADPNTPASAAALAVAGLATLRPGAQFDPTKLLEASTAGPTRTYVTSLGHTLWNTVTLVAGYTADNKKDPVGCLQRNHTDLVAHIDALASIVTWGAERVRTGVGLSDKQAGLVRNAIIRLRALEGGGNTTYSTKVAALRIAPIDDALKSAARAT